MRALVLAALALLGAGCLPARAETAAARSDAARSDAAVCNAAIAGAERRSLMPKRVMSTIALVESGRMVGRRVVPWPWSINVGGVGYQFATKEEAIAAAERFTAAGERSIDVGCMQINLRAHPTAFPSLEAAFEPTANATYAAQFLRSLYQQSGTVATAMTAYHSQTPEFANDYARRLLAVWPGAADLGLTATDAAPARSARSPSSRLAAKLGGPVAGASGLRLVSVHGAAWPR